MLEVFGWWNLRVFTVKLFQPGILLLKATFKPLLQKFIVYVYAVSVLVISHSRNIPLLWDAGTLT